MQTRLLLEQFSVIVSFISVTSSQNHFIVGFYFLFGFMRASFVKPQIPSNAQTKEGFFLDGVLGLFFMY